MAPFRAEDHLASYFALARREKALERDEEIALFQRFRAGKPEAGERLVRASSGQVLAIARRYRRYGVPVAGLVRALEKFDPERGTRFMTYAAHWVPPQRAKLFVFLGATSGSMRRRPRSTPFHFRSRSASFERVEDENGAGMKA